MLKFQVGEYCICIWDGEQTKLGDALKSLEQYTEDEKTVREHQRFTVSVWTFDQDSDDDKAKKILEEASKVRGALQYEGREAGQTLYEICDTITACLNLAAALGYTQAQVQEKLDMVEASNRKLGRYENLAGQSTLTMVEASNRKRGHYE